MKNIILKVNDAVKTLAEHQIVTQDGKPTVIKATGKVNYELIDQATGHAPDHIITKRVGKDLHVSMDGDGKESDLIIEGYYDQADSALIGLAEDGSYYYYVPDTGEVADFVTELAEGDIEGQALGGSAQPTPYWVGAAESNDGFAWLPWLAGLAGLGAIAALASDDDDDDSPKDTTPPATPTTAPVVTDNVADDGSVLDPAEVIADGQDTNDNTPSVTIPAGQLQDGETPQLVVDGQVVPSTSVTNPDGSVTLTPTDTLTDGEHELSYNVKDAAGNTSGNAPSTTVGVDTVAPDQTTTIINIIDDVAPQTGPVNSGGSTNDVAPTIKGTISAVISEDEIVVVYRDGVKVGTADVTNTTWSFEDTGLTDGKSYTYTAQVEDAAGNQGSVSNDYSINVDTKAPTESVTITSVTDDVDPVQGVIAKGGSTNDTTPLVAGTLSAALETGEVVVVLRNGQVIGKASVDGTNWSFADSGLADGENYTYTARVEDAAGNRGAISGNYSINVDTSAPTQTTTITNIVDDVAPQTGTVANDVC